MNAMETPAQRLERGAARSKLAATVGLLAIIISGLIVPGCADVEAVPSPLSAPAVVSIAPADGTTGVLRNSQLSVRFSAEMDPTSTEAALALNPPAPGTVFWDEDGMGLTYKPDTLLGGGNEYILSVDDTATSLTGVALAAPGSAYFVTEAGTEPLVDGTIPESGEDLVAINFKVVITFTEPMDPATTAAAVLFEPGVAFSTDLSSDGTVLTLTPDVSYEPFTTYQVTVGATATAVGGTPLYAPSVIRFTTDDHSL